MIERQETVYEGENLGPIDWSYDFYQHDWNHGGGTNPKVIEQAVDFLHLLTDGGKYEATTDGGWPRVGWGEVLAVAMYDGWPYWRPVPSVLIQGFLGASWNSFCAITDVRKID